MDTPLRIIEGGKSQQLPKWVMASIRHIYSASKGLTAIYPFIERLDGKANIRLVLCGSEKQGSMLNIETWLNILMEVCGDGLLTERTTDVLPRQGLNVKVFQRSEHYERKVVCATINGESTSPEPFTTVYASDGHSDDNQPQTADGFHVEFTLAFQRTQDRPETPEGFEAMEPVKPWLSWLYGTSVFQAPSEQIEYNLNALADCISGLELEVTDGDLTEEYIISVYLNPVDGKTVVFDTELLKRYLGDRVDIVNREDDGYYPTILSIDLPNSSFGEDGDEKIWAAICGPEWVREQREAEKGI